MDGAKRNERIKKLCFLLLKSEGKGKEQRMVFFNNSLAVIFFLLLILVDLAKNFYFFSTTLSLNERLLYGDIVISDQEEQRLFNLILWVGYLFTLMYVYSYYFDLEKAHFKRFYQLSDFLMTVLDLNEYRRKFFLTKEFAEKHFKEIELRIRICQFLINSYALSTNSYYLVSLCLLVGRGYSFNQILLFTCPSVVVGSLAMMFCFTISVKAFTFYMLQIKLICARVQRLTADLDRLTGRFKRKKLIDHLVHLNSLIKEFGTSRRFFGKSLCLVVPAVISTLGLFPSMVILSGRFFSNRLIVIYVLNLTMLLYPIMKSNEKFKREVRFQFRLHFQSLS